MNNLSELYQNLIEQKRINLDKQQHAVVYELQELSEQLSLGNNKSILGIIKKFIMQPKQNSKCGLYIWGGVGRGKTFLMDLFYENLEVKNKLRLHFHKFMYLVHDSLKKYSSEKDPLKHVITQFYSYKVICFDEFFVKDIADAMILGRIFNSLLQKKIKFILTSNIHPKDLYKNGLQRQRFKPTIKLIKDKLKIINLDSGVDYRLKAFENLNIFHVPADDDANAKLRQSFESLALGEIIWDIKLEILGRMVLAKAMADDIVWFDFEVLCKSARSQIDYLEIAKSYHTLFLSNVRQMDSNDDSTARRFINLIDILYDHKVKLLITSMVDIDNLYIGDNLAFEFARTKSRMQEMQTKDYIGSEHIV